MVVVDDDAGELGRSDAADRLVVVGADHGDLFGDDDVGALAGLEELLAHEVGAGHDPGGRSRRAIQAASACCCSSQMSGPLTRGGRGSRCTTQPKPGRPRPSPRTPPADGRTRTWSRPSYSMKPKRRKPRARRCFRPEAADGVIVGVDERHAREAGDAHHVHHRDPQLADGFKLIGEHRGDDPVAPPPLQPAAERAVDAEGFEVDGPRLVLVDIAGHPVEHPPPRRGGRIHEQRHGGGASCGGRRSWQLRGGGKAAAERSGNRRLGGNCRKCANRSLNQAAKAGLRACDTG